MKKKGVSGLSFRVLILGYNKIIYRKLTALAYDVCAVAESRQEAERYLKKFHPDLLFINESQLLVNDINLFPHIPIIIFGDKKQEGVYPITSYQYLSSGCSKYDLELHIALVLEQFSMERRFLENQKRLETTLNSLIDGVITTDEYGNIMFMNPIAEKLLHLSYPSAKGKPVQEIFTLDRKENLSILADPVMQVLQRNITNTTFAPTTLQIPWRSTASVSIEYTAAPIKDVSENIIGVVLVLRDVTDRKIYEQRIEDLAYNDQLTGLPNRFNFSQLLHKALKRSKRKQSKFALLFIDLDGFKLVNDSVGHAVGDQLLKEVGRKLSTCIRKRDSVSRQGGDEFTVILSDIEAQEEASIVADKIISCIAQPFIFKRNTITITPSIGISLYPQDGSSFEELLKHADSAMYNAKKNGGNQYYFYK